MSTRSEFARRLIDATAMFVMSLLCLSFLIFIAYGTTKRTYEQLLIEKGMAQAELVRSPMETYLRPGLPLRQFSGFKGLTSSITDGDQTVVAVVVEATDGDRVFSAGDGGGVRTLPPQSAISMSEDGAEVRQSESILQVVLPLRNKFERVGNLVATMDRSQIDARITEEFRMVAVVALLASFGFAIVIFRASHGSHFASRKVVAISFSTSFVIVALAVIVTMISLFAAGAQSKGRALVNSLGQRLDDIPQYGLQLEQIDGLGDVLDKYRQLNPEISSIGIAVNGRVAFHTDASRIGNFWVRNSAQSEYQAALTPPNHPRAAYVILTVPKSFVIWQVARNVKNYAALFVACAMFAFLFMQVAQAIRTAHNSGRTTSSESDWRSELALDLVKPLYFAAVFVDHLSFAFLPQYIADVVHQAGDSSNSTAWPFTAYYICFALTLIPAGRYGLRFGARNLAISGLFMICAGLLSMALVNTLGAAVLARALTGIGQGALFIGVQSFILTKALREQRTKANGIIVYGYQGGMISGMAIGSLLVGEIGAAGVFAVAAFVTAVAIAYTFLMLPKDKISEAALDDRAGPLNVIWHEIGQLLRDTQFMQIILLIGIPAKAVLTGIVLFAMPLLLTGMGFAREDIGQITMIYAGCVILSSTIAGHFADRLQACRRLLVWGALLTSVGLVVIGTSGSSLIVTSLQASVWQTLLIILGSAILGGAHGLINAPVVTHITDTPAAARIGHGATAAAYRFLERIGHSLGPIIVSQLFLAFGTSPLVLGGIGGFMLVLAIVFHLSNPAETTSGQNREFA